MNFKTSASIAITLTCLLASARADITSDLFLRMTMDETSGLVASDASGNGNAGTLTGFSGDNSYWTNGWIAGALAFNQPNVTNYVSIPDNGSLNLTNGAYTLAAWITMNNVQLNGSCVIARGTGNGGESYDLDVQGNRYRVVTRNSAKASTVLTATVAPANNVWQHVAVTCDT